jgi:hypothetical protein
MAEIERMMLAERICERMEWDAVRLGPSMSPQNHKVSTRWSACPLCYRVKPGAGAEKDFPAHLIGTARPACSASGGR